MIHICKTCSLPSKSDDDGVLQEFLRHESHADLCLAEADELSVGDADVEDVVPGVQSLQRHHRPLGPVNLEEVGREGGEGLARTWRCLVTGGRWWSPPGALGAEQGPGRDDPDREDMEQFFHSVFF